MIEFFTEFDIHSIEWYIWAAIGVYGFCLLVQLYYYLYFYAGVLYRRRQVRKSKVSFLTDKPGVSVIICARNESENLVQFLPSVLNQNYPNFEVIVVNDGSSDETEAVLVEFEKEYKNLYHSYVPEEVQVMSTKKLALTIAVKAAKNDLLLFTDADCKPVSENWIREMTKNFVPQTDIVLGYGAYERKRGLLSHLISFDTFFIALQYMGFALRGKPYMGVGRNMTYRKEVFFKMKGFASMLHLQSGDDDLFVNRAATKNNTRIEINPDSTTISVPKETLGSWYIQKERHLSTSPAYRSQTKRLIGGEVLTRAFFYLSLVALCVFAPLQISLPALCGLLLRYITQAIIINVSAKHFKERRFYLSIVFFDILLPLISLFAMVENSIRKKHVYQWK